MILMEFYFKNSIFKRVSNLKDFKKKHIFFNSISKTNMLFHEAFSIHLVPLFFSHFQLDFVFFALLYVFYLFILAFWLFLSRSVGVENDFAHFSMNKTSKSKL
jgi:hypothetical protein